MLTFSGEEGTVVYTQMKVLENLPITLTSPRIWEALGLPLTPFEDSINFFADPGAMFEESVRPFVAMKARLRRYDPERPRRHGRSRCCRTASRSSDSAPRPSTFPTASAATRTSVGNQLASHR